MVHIRLPRHAHGGKQTNYNGTAFTAAINKIVLTCLTMIRTDLFLNLIHVECMYKRTPEMNEHSRVYI